MKALTLKQPWPAMFLLEDDPKRIENRDWPAPRALIGQRLALHGGKVPTGRAALDEVRQALDWVNDAVWGGDEDPAEWLGDPELKALCVSGIYGVAKVTDVVRVSDDPWFVGEYGWVLTDFVAIDPPVPHRGAQGLWDVNPEALALVRERYRAATRGAAPAQPAAQAAPPAQIQPDEDEEVPLILAHDLTPEQRAQLVGQVVTLDQTRGAFWSFPQVQDARRKALADLGCAALWAELARAQQLYGRTA